MNQLCPLCHTAIEDIFHADARRTYCRCPQCMLVFVPPDQYPSTEAERAEYDLHRNSPDDEGYRRFLGRLFDPLQARLAPGSSGLDFGSGPGPTLSVMLTEAGHSMRIYDKFYAPDTSVFDRQYDFITATEVVEHLHQPDFELARIWNCLKPGGLLGIMTKLVIDRNAFADWHYKNDPTHVLFFCRETFVRIADRRQAVVEFRAPDVIILQKPFLFPE